MGLEEKPYTYSVGHKSRSDLIVETPAILVFLFPLNKDIVCIVASST